MASTGWTFEEVSQHTLWDLKDLNTYWASHPPVHLLVAGYLGFKAPAAEKATPTKLRDLAAVFGLPVKEGP